VLGRLPERCAVCLPLSVYLTRHAILLSTSPSAGRVRAGRERCCVPGCRLLLRLAPSLEQRASATYLHSPGTGASRRGVQMLSLPGVATFLPASRPRAYAVSGRDCPSLLRSLPAAVAGLHVRFLGLLLLPLPRLPTP